MSVRVHFRAELRRWQSESAWHFITVPKSVSRDIRLLSQGQRNAFSSLRVIAKIGETEWRTSVFADTKSDAFLLPVKADVRRRQKIGHGDKVSVTLEIDL